MNVNYYLQKDYENERLRRPHGKQSETKPISGTGPRTKRG
jgi:hypothetical protein